MPYIYIDLLGCGIFVNGSLGVSLLFSNTLIGLWDIYCTLGLIDTFEQGQWHSNRKHHMSVGEVTHLSQTTG